MEIRAGFASSSAAGNEHFGAFIGTYPINANNNNRTRKVLFIAYEPRGSFNGELQRRDRFNNGANDNQLIKH